MDVQNIIGVHKLTRLHRVGSSLPFENLKILSIIGDELIHYMPGAFGMALPQSITNNYSMPADPRSACTQPLLEMLIAAVHLRFPMANATAKKASAGGPHKREGRRNQGRKS